MLVDEGTGVTLARDPAGPNSPRAIARLVVAVGTPVVIVLLVAGIAGAGVVLVVLAVVVAVVVGVVARAGRIDWTMSVTADEIRLRRAHAPTIGPHERVYRRGEFAGYSRTDLGRGRVSFAPVTGDFRQVRGHVVFSKEVADVDEIDQAMARFDIPRLTRADRPSPNA